MRKTKLIILLTLAMAALTAYGQIDNQVIGILEQCQKVMHSDDGTELDMNLNVKIVGIISTNGTIKTYTKGAKSLTQVKMKLMGREITTLSGNDGTNDWFFRPAMDDRESDTIYIIKPDKSKKKDFDMSLDLHKTYSAAKLKEDNLSYEISFSKPKDKDFPKKTILKINKKDNTLKEMTIKDGANSMRMTVTRIKHGIADSQVTLDLKKYPNAKVVRR